ncbi:MAG: nucleotidyltransferase [Planctomycetes bacterium]|nr:nucleotidyltransferase [Planctomycetota bacterium]
MPYPDFEEFITSLNAHGVRYLVIGAHALAHHAFPRATKDLDLLIEPADDNAGRLLEAISEFFGGADLGYSVEDVTDPETILQLGVAPVRIDLLSRIPGCPRFSEFWDNRVLGSFGNVPANFIGLDDLIAAKEAAGRPQDLADLHELRRLRDKTGDE